MIVKGVDWYVVVVNVVVIWSGVVTTFFDMMVILSFAVCIGRSVGMDSVKGHVVEMPRNILTLQKLGISVDAN